MDENMNSDNSDATIDVDEVANRLGQVREGDKSTGNARQVICFALPCFICCLAATLGYVDEIFRGTEVPLYLWVLLPLISLATSLYTVRGLRVSVHGFWRTPAGVTTSSLIRLIGGMICLVAVLIGIALSLDESRMRSREDDLLLMFWCFALGLLMRLFPREESA